MIIKVDKTPILFETIAHRDFKCAVCKGWIRRTQWMLVEQHLLGVNIWHHGCCPRPALAKGTASHNRVEFKQMGSRMVWAQFDGNDYYDVIQRPLTGFNKVRNQRILAMPMFSSFKNRIIMLGGHNTIADAFFCCQQEAVFKIYASRNSNEPLERQGVFQKKFLRF